MIPVISFTKDTEFFCKPMSVAETILLSIYSFFAFLCNLLGPSFFDAAHVFNFYNFPFRYTSWEDGIVWLALFACVIVVPKARKLLDQYEQRRDRRIMPADVS